MFFRQTTVIANANVISEIVSTENIALKTKTNFVKRLFLFLALLIICLSCQKEGLHIPDLGRKIVINGLVIEDSLLKVRISKSLYYNDHLSSPFDSGLVNANVFFFEDDKIIDTLKYRYGGETWNVYGSLCENYYSSKKSVSTGKEYKVLVQAPGLPDAWASTNIPGRVRIEKMDTSHLMMPPDPYHSNDNWILLLCNLTFTDPPGETNYYMVSVDIKPRVWRDSHLLLYTQDIIGEEKMTEPNGIYAIAFSDKAINGTRYSLQIGLNTHEIGLPFIDDRPTMDGVPYYTEHRKVIYIKLYSITEDYFNFLRTYNLYRTNYGDALAEPIMIYSNISGGYGIFGGASVSCDSLVFTY